VRIHWYNWQVQRDCKDGLWHFCILYLENLIAKFYMGLPGENTRRKKSVTEIYKLFTSGTNVKTNRTRNA
jgi:hypothetical protein